MTETALERETRLSLTQPGDPVTLQVVKKLLPPHSADLESWITGLPADGESVSYRNLYLHGAHGVGKTWVAIDAMLRKMAISSPLIGLSPGYWTEGRYAKDLQRLRGYERLVQNAGGRDQSQWDEYLRFEFEFEKLSRSEYLIFDELFYNGLLDFVQTEIAQLLRERLVSPDRCTVIVSNSTPESGSALESAVLNYCWIERMS